MTDKGLKALDKFLLNCEHITGCEREEIMEFADKMEADE
jgi:hypothetical protein